MAWPGEDDWDRDQRRRRPSAQRFSSDARRSSQFLSPGFDPGGLYRTRSQGAGPVPMVNVYNDIIQDAYLRGSSRSPPQQRTPYPPSPEFRGRNSRLGDDLLAEEIANLALENQRLRSRSRGRSDAGFWMDGREERLRSEFEIRRLQEEAKREADARVAKDREKQIIDDYQRKQREEEQERKDEEKRLRDKIAREAVEAKEKEEREWKEFLQKQKDKEAKEEADKKAKEAEIEDAMRKRLGETGFSYTQIEAIINAERAKKTTTTTTTITTNNARADQLWSPQPVYPKVHRKHLSVDTLRYYQVPYERDKINPEYIIILRQMDKYTLEALFDHTRRLRKGAVLLEPARRDREFAFFRRRDRSTSRVNRVGVLELRW